MELPLNGQTVFDLPNGKDEFLSFIGNDFHCFWLFQEIIS